MGEIEIYKSNDYKELLTKIETRIEDGVEEVSRAVIKSMLGAFWDTGKYITDFEQDGKARAEYGSQLLKKLSKDLTLSKGKGYSTANLYNMRQFYQVYPNGYEQLLPLTWSHICILMRIEDPLEREFYEKQCIAEKWNVRVLKRQKESALYLRLASNRDKDEIIDLSKKGVIPEKPEDVIKDVYTLEFLHINPTEKFSEGTLEKKLIQHLNDFIMEMGRGFTFVKEQYPMRINNHTYKCDLVFYNRILKCFFLVDLKVDAVQHEDIGQMNMYMGYFAEEINEPDDNPPVGLVLARERDELLIKYATYGMDSNLFVSKYELYLPNEEELRRLVQEVLDDENS